MAAVTGRRRTIYRKKHQNKFSMFLVTLVVIMILVVVAFKSIQLQTIIDSKQNEIDKLNESISYEMNRKEEIEDYKKYVQTDAFVEKVARSKLGLVYENEIVFKRE